MKNKKNILQEIYDTEFDFREVGTSNNYRDKKISSFEELEKYIERNGANTSYYIGSYGYKAGGSNTAKLENENNAIINSIFLDFDLTLDEQIYQEFKGDYSRKDISKLSDDKKQELKGQIEETIKTETSGLSDDDLKRYWVQKFERNYLELPIKEAKKIANELKKTGVETLLNFSGGKGCHLRILFPAVELENPNIVIKEFAERLENRFNLQTLDEAVIKAPTSRVERIPTFRHNKTGLYGHFFNLDTSYDDIIANAEYVESEIEVSVIDHVSNELFSSRLKQEDIVVSDMLENQDTGLNGVISSLTTYNLSDSVKEDKLVSNFLKIYRHGQYNTVGFSYIHLLRRAGISKEDVVNFFKKVDSVLRDNNQEHDFKKVQDWINRAYNIKLNDPTETKHLGGLNLWLETIKKATNKEQANKLIKFYNRIFKKEKIDINKLDDDVKQQYLYDVINTKLNNAKAPSIQELAMYITSDGNYFCDWSTMTRYKKTENGLVEINTEYVAKQLNNDFGENKFEIRTIEKAIGYITKSIPKDYNLIQFANGLLNTKTGEFKEEHYETEILPKLNTTLMYTPEAEELFKETELYKKIEWLLKPTDTKESWEWNSNLFYKSVGNCAFAINEAGRFFILNGRPNSGKSTLLLLLKRIFSYSEVKITAIAKHERFGLAPLLGKDVNFDDDVSKVYVEDVTTLNSVVTGDGIEVELKGLNERLKLDSVTTPKLWGAGNQLPFLKGAGKDRRTCLILVDNIISNKNDDVTFKPKIANGELDAEIGLFFSYCIQEAFKHRNEPFLSEEQEAVMLGEWEWKSNPVNIFADYVFINSNMRKTIFKEWKERLIDGEYVTSDGEYVLSVTTVNQLYEAFKQWALNEKLIFGEQILGKSRGLKIAMENHGYFNNTIYMKEEDKNGRNKTLTRRVYMNCSLNPLFIKLVNGNSSLEEFITEKANKLENKEPKTLFGFNKLGL